MANSYISMTLGMFLLCSVLGWIIESGFRTLTERRGFINSGLLHGPIIPIYGIGANAICIVNDLMVDSSIYIRAVVFAILCSAIEYFISLFFDIVFKIRLWDYSDKKFSLHGRIYLPFSLAWMALSIGFILVIRPIAEKTLAEFFTLPLSFLVLVILIVIVLFDAIISIAELPFVARVIKKMFISKTDILFFKSLIASVTDVRLRLFQVFPHTIKIMAKKFTMKLIERSIEERGRGNVSKAIAVIFNQPIMLEDVDDPDFLAVISDLVLDLSVQSMALYKHHDASTFKHALTVSLISYYLAKSFDLDEISTARGALLHDFYLYDWRNPKYANHATKHAKRALDNARSRFDLNLIEEDIILTHMWPITKPFYSYKESFLVSTVDKVVSTKEAVSMIKAYFRKE